MLESILKLDGRPHTAHAVSEAFKSEKIRFANADSREAAGSGPVVAKHLAIVRRASTAGVLAELEDLANVGGDATALSKDFAFATCFPTSQLHARFRGVHAPRALYGILEEVFVASAGWLSGLRQ